MNKCVSPGSVREEKKISACDHFNMGGEREPSIFKVRGETQRWLEGRERGADIFSKIPKAWL